MDEFAAARTQKQLTSMSSPSCIFLIHLLACPCGSIINGHLVPLVTKIAESVDTCKVTKNIHEVQCVQTCDGKSRGRTAMPNASEGRGSASVWREKERYSSVVGHFAEQIKQIVPRVVPPKQRTRTFETCPSYMREGLMFSFM